jgi:microcystin-dependent protein
MRFPQESNGIGNMLHCMWPVGSVFVSVVNTDPAILFGFGVWEAIGAGRCLVGLDAGQTEFDTLEETGGVKEVTLTGTQSGVAAHAHAVTDPGHTHLTQRYPTATGGSSGFTIDTSMSGTLADNTLPTKSATTGLTVNSVADAPAAQAHTNLMPFLVVRFWKRTA